MIDLAYWDTEIASFKTLFAKGLDDTKVRFLLRGLTILATELTQDQPADADKILADLHACLWLVHDEGIELQTESWLRNHASAAIRESVEREFAHVRTHGAVGSAHLW